MNIFKNTNLKWWQLEILNFSVLGVGILLGLYFREVALALLWPIVFITVVCSLYISIIWWQGHKN